MRNEKLNTRENIENLKQAGLAATAVVAAAETLLVAYNKTYGKEADIIKQIKRLISCAKNLEKALAQA